MDDYVRIQTGKIIEGSPGTAGSRASWERVPEGPKPEGPPVYTPTTEEVRDGWNSAVIDSAAPKGALVDSDWGEQVKTDAQFDRWLASVRADAWDEGAQWAAVELGAIKRVENQWVASADNPYRSEKQ